MPGYLGQALNWLPWIGTLIALGLFVYALILLWRVIPVYLAVPDGKRAAHYIVSLVTTIIAFVLVSILMRPLMGSAVPGMSGFADATSGSGPK